jgi:hypothetical protein
MKEYVCNQQVVVHTVGVGYFNLQALRYGELITPPNWIITTTIVQHHAQK